MNIDRTRAATTRCPILHFVSRLANVVLILAVVKCFVRVLTSAVAGGRGTIQQSGASSQVPFGVPRSRP